MTKSINIDSISDLKKLEEIIRTNKNVFEKVSRCYQCTSDGKSFCNRCANCIEWHWDKDIVETADNYRFRYLYWKTFADMETK